MNPIREDYNKFSDDYKQHKPWLKNVIREVEINCPDSIAIAKGILTKNGIQIPELDALHKLQQSTESSKRNLAFAKHSKELQQEIIRKLKNM